MASKAAAESYIVQILKSIDRLNRDSSRKHQQLRDACKAATGMLFLFPNLNKNKI